MSELDLDTMLFLRYKKPVIPLSVVIADYLPHLNAETAKKKASISQLPFPAFKPSKNTRGDCRFGGVAHKREGTSQPRLAKHEYID